jgi:hypothetical protein
MLKLLNAFEGLDVEDPPSELEEIVVETQLVKKPKSWEKTYEMEDPISDASVTIHPLVIIKTDWSLVPHGKFTSSSTI